MPQSLPLRLSRSPSAGRFLRMLMNLDWIGDGTAMPPARRIGDTCRGRARAVANTAIAVAGAARSADLGPPAVA